jgi:hypothetical protein
MILTSVGFAILIKPYLSPCCHFIFFEKKEIFEKDLIRLILFG